MTAPLRVANSSGFLGDRFEAPRQMIDGGPIDVLTGDYLAELTMAILMRQRLRNPDHGFARTFLAQIEGILADCLAADIKVVTNAGGLNPVGLSRAIGDMAKQAGLNVVVATVTGDDLMAEVGSGPPTLLEPGTRAGFEPVFTPVTANAYLGGWGIAHALGEGADVVVAGRVTDAALTMGPAAWHFGWRRDDWDELAGALAAGHIIECGPQATGGNYSFFEEIPGLVEPGFPIAEVHDDGTAVITKHPHTGGKVSVGTVTEQLLYEIGGPVYVNPDVSARFDTIELVQDGDDRVLVSGARGMPPPATTRVAVTGLDGFRNAVTFALTGGDIAAKAELVEQGLWRRLGGRSSVEEAVVRLHRTDQADPPSNEAATAFLDVAVFDGDEDRVGRRFSNAAVELALSSYPGLYLTSPPTPASPLLRFAPATVAQQPSLVTVNGETAVVAPTSGASNPALTEGDLTTGRTGPLDSWGATVRVPLGAIAGARSGDKGGDANLGVWARDEAAFAWLDAYLTVAELRRLLPETSAYFVERFRFPNLNALNFVVVGLLGAGVADSTRRDPQAKSLGEYLRARVVDAPMSLVSS